MELLHGARVLQEWFNGLSPQTQAWLIKAYWVIVPLGLMILIYVVVREEKVSESGKVIVRWYHPKHWVSHFKQIKAENEAKFAHDNASFYSKVQMLLALGNQLKDVIYDFLFVLVGLLGVVGVLMAIAMNPLKAWWILIPCAFAVYIGFQSLRKLINRIYKKQL